MPQPISRRTFLRLSVVTAAAVGGWDRYPGASVQAGSQAAQITTPPIFIDGHLDLGWNLVSFGRDYTRSAYALRQDAAAGQVMVGLPELLAGRVALLLGIIFAAPSGANLAGSAAARYSTAEEANTVGWRMLSALEALAESSPQFTLVRTAPELDAVLARWEPDQPEDARQIGIIIGMEGADPIRSAAELPDWYARGLRSIGLSWERTRYAGSNSTAGDLTVAGRELLLAMSALGMVFDVAHLSEAAFWQALDVWQGPIMYSHGNSRRYLPTERGLSDDQVRELVARDGVIGIGLYNGFWQQRRRTPETVTLEDVADAIDYVCQLVGSCAHVALGSDADGGFGAEMAPINTLADLPLLADVFAGRGYSADDVNALAYGNWLRIWRAVLPLAR